MQSNRGFLGRVESPELGVGGRRQLLTCRVRGRAGLGLWDFGSTGRPGGAETEPGPCSGQVVPALVLDLTIHLSLMK